MDAPFDEWSTHDVPVSSISAMRLVSGPPAPRNELSASGELNGRVRKEPLKRGRHGETWKGSLAGASGSGQGVAIKTIRLKSTRGGESMPLIQLDSVVDVKDPLQEFLKYSRERKLFKHKSIVPSLGICTDLESGSAAPSLISPWYKHGSIEEWCKSPRALSRDHRAHKAEQLSEGLHFLHSCGIIHGNLVPSNILIDDFYRVCIGDWDLWRFAEVDETEQAKVKGTTQYLAPELLRTTPEGRREMERTMEMDMYAFGITCLQLLTGKAPYPSKHLPGTSKPDADIARLVLAHPGYHPHRDNFPELTSYAAWSALEACWKYEPAARAQARDVKEYWSGRLRTSMDEQPAQNHKTKPKPQSPRDARKGTR